MSGVTSVAGPRISGPFCHFDRLSVHCFSSNQRHGLQQIHILQRTDVECDLSEHSITKSTSTDVLILVTICRSNLPASDEGP